MGAEVVPSGGSNRRCGGRNRRGFTLIELIVTLFVLALAAGLAMPAIGRSTDGLRARAEVSGVAAFIRRAREGAIIKREVRVVTFDATERVMTDATGDREVRARRRLPDRLSVEAEVTDAAIRFTPEGLSSGARLRLVTAGGASYRVTVDPVTGRVVSRREDGP